MPVVAVIGAQWGDEGKGRIVDLLAQQARVVIRSSGGPNAGHTVINKYGTFRLHLLPAGIFNANAVNVIGTNVVVDPAVLLGELESAGAAGTQLGKLVISDRAHVIMPYHIQLDKLEEQSKGTGKLGTTGRGVGPAYSDKVNRVGIRMGDLIHEETLLSRLTHVLEQKQRVLTKLYGATPDIALHEAYLQYLAYGNKLREYIVPIHPVVQRALEKDSPILIEGNQGALLDLDYGTYPFVTGTSTGTAGLLLGAGVAPSRLNSSIGVFKAYVTRVGAGPFPTELNNEQGEELRQRGKEYGTTTGRPRRCGWFDAVMARYTTEINGIDTIAITKLDVLDTLPRIRICVGYRLHDTELDYLPAATSVLDAVEPIYEDMPGWMTPTSHIRSFEALPEAAQRYITRLCQLIGARLGMISIGPERDQVIMLTKVF
jgi:adenylosuccinate synthase